MDKNDGLKMINQIIELMLYSEQNEINRVEILQKVLELLNQIKDVKKAFYIRDIRPRKVVMPRGTEGCKTLDNNLDNILDTWRELKQENENLKYISLREMISRNHNIIEEKCDNIDVEKVIITDAFISSNKNDLFIIEKHTTCDLDEEDMSYIYNIGICAKFIYEKILMTELHLKNEKVLVQVLNNIDALIYVSDVETEEILFINELMKKAFNIEDMKSKKCWQVFQDNFVNTCDFCPVHKLKTVDDPPVVWEEYNTVTKKFYQNTDRLINWVDDRVVHIQHSIDITDIKIYTNELNKKREELEEAIETIKTVRNEQDERTRIMLDATPLCCNLWNEKFENIQCNQEAVNLFELSSKEEYLERFFELSPEYQPCGRPTKEMALENIKKAFNDGYVKFEWMHQKLNGELIPAEITLVRVKHEDENIVAGYTRDLREQKAMLAEIQKTEDDLRLARDVAEKNAKAKGEFLSKMSHELRTPLNAIIGMLNIIDKSNDTVRIKEAVPKMKSASMNLLQTINDILDISKIEAGKMELLLSEFNIDRMFRNIFDIIEFSAHEKEIDIEVNVENSIYNNFIGDQNRLSQVYMNLLSNAIKFTEPKGKISVCVKYEKREDNKIEIISTVTDTGVGIPEDKINSVFESFVQVDNKLSRQYSGTGLGLVISKSIVELMGGNIAVTSEPKVGTTFSFNVILECSKEQEKVEVSTDVFNILVIDDSEETCRYLSDLFSIRGIKHKTALSGKDGIKLLNEEMKLGSSFNIILIDYMMPDMNGIETIRKIKDSISTETILIMISSMDWTQIKDEAEAVGVNMFLPKPMLPSDVINSINNIFNKKSIKHTENENEVFNFSDKTILLFEDIEVNREIIQFILEDTGVKCVEAVDGLEGVNLYYENPERYDLILMDIQMPNMDGFEATKKIRESGKPNSDTIPIIAMTANVFANEIQNMLDAGMNSHLGKPVDEKELKTELKKFLEGR